MTRLTGLILLFLTTTKLNAQEISVDWMKSLGGNRSDFAYAAACDNSGNLVVTGSFQGAADFDPGLKKLILSEQNPGKDVQDIYLTKLSAGGELIWAFSIGGTLYDEGNSVCLDSSGNIYLTGCYTGSVDFDPGEGKKELNSNGGSKDIFVAKYTGDGQFVWAKSMGSTYADNGTGIALDANDNIFICGNYNGPADFGSGFHLTLKEKDEHGFFVSKLDKSGNLMWVKSLGAATAKSPTQIVADDAGNILVPGYFDGVNSFEGQSKDYKLTSAGMRDAFICKLNAGGKLVWVKQFGGTKHDEFNSLTADRQGNIYAGGYFMNKINASSAAGNWILAKDSLWGIAIAKYTKEGSLVWLKGMGGSGGFGEGRGIKTDAESNLFCLANYNGTLDIDPGPAENLQHMSGAFVAKLDSNGTFLWAKQTGIQQAWALVFNPANKKFYVAGHLFGSSESIDGLRKINSFGASDAVLMQVSERNTIAANKQAYGQPVEQQSTKVKNDSTVYQIGIYPNPDNGQYTISVPDEDLNIIIVVYDTNGRLITAQSCPAGFTILNMEKEKPGVYVFKIKNGREVMDTRNIVKG